MKRSGTAKTFVTLAVGLFCGFLISPISLWVLVLKMSPDPHDSFSMSEGGTDPAQFLKRYTRNETVAVVMESDGSTVTDSSQNQYSQADELVEIAVLSSAKFLHSRGIVAYHSYGKSLNKNFKIYTFPSKVHQTDMKNKRQPVIGEFVKYMKDIKLNVTHAAKAGLSKPHFFQFLSHICQNAMQHPPNSHFLLLLPDDTYVHVKNLHDFIYSLLLHTSTPPAYTGLQSKNGHCEIGNGILLHQTALLKICPDRDRCWHLAQDSEVSEAEVLGMCFSKILKTDCWSPEQVKRLFYNDKNGKLNSKSLHHNEILQKAITIHPILDQVQFTSIHRYISEMQVNALIKEAGSVVENVVNMENFTTKRKPSDKWVWYKGPKVNPKSRHDVLLWQYVDTSNVYQLHEHLPSYGLSSRHKSSLNTALQVFIEKANSTGRFKSGTPSVNEAYFAVDEASGIEYILNVAINKKSNYLANVLLPFKGPGLSFSYPTNDFIHNMVNIIIPISHYHNLVPFLEMYENECIGVVESEPVCLHLVFFSHDEVITRRISQIKAIYQSVRIEIHEIEGKPFSASYAYNHVAELLSSSELMLFFNINLQFTGKFLSHCRMNTIQDKQVFSPILFSQYRSDLVPSELPSQTDKHLITSENGFFLRYNYQVLCIYRSDYAKIGGYKRSMQQSSSVNDDLQLVANILKSDIYFMRALEPFLTKPFQSSKCDSLKTKEAQETCIKSVAESIGSKKSLGSYLLRKGLL